MTVQQSGGALTLNEIPTRDFEAWIDLQPGVGRPPFPLYVTGEVLVPNPGVFPFLVERKPSDPTNLRVLELELYLEQKPGPWPPVEVWKPVKFRKLVSRNLYDFVFIYFDGKIILKLEVREVH